MTEMVEIETQNFLRELDSFGLPPPPQKLFSNNYSKAFSREFENKLHHINVEKQMVSHLGSGIFFLTFQFLCFFLVSLFPVGFSILL